MVSDDELQDGIAEKFETLVVEVERLALKRKAGMRQGFGEKDRIAELVPDVTLQRIHVRGELSVGQIRNRLQGAHGSLQAAKEKFGIGFGAPQVLHECFHRLDGRKFVELLAQNHNAGHLIRMIEVFLAASSRFGDMDGGENALVRNGAVEVNLHVSRALEFLEDEVVHSALGLDQGCGDDGQAAAFFGVPGGTKKTLGLHPGFGVHTARHYSSLARLEIVVAAGETRDAVEEDDRILA